MKEPKWRLGQERNNHHWLFGGDDTYGGAKTGIVLLNGVWSIWTHDADNYGKWIPHPEYNGLSVDEMKAVALAVSRMGG